jgi:hypothetical protein
MTDPKILIIFRGGYNRVSNVEFVAKNIKQYIIEPLKYSNLKFNVLFSTYNENSEKLEIYKKYLEPSKIFFTSNGQIINFKESLENIKTIYEEYSHIVFLRFEAIYKIPIRTWNFFNREGLILPFKEDTPAIFNRHGWYNDSIIILSTSFYLKIKEAVLTASNHLFQPATTLHNLANIVKLYDKSIPIEVLVDGFFQSNSPGFPQIDGHLSPFYILVHYPYYGSDRTIYGV